MVTRLRIHGALLAMLLPFNADGQSDASVAIDDPQDFVLWNAAYVEATADRLYKSLHDKDLVWETVGNYAGHSAYLVLRGKTDRPEVHDTESDIQISMRGKATSVIGGRLVDAVSLPRKQRRGTAIDGGNRRQLTPGDIMHVPPGVPHQLIIDPAEPYLYLLIKIDEEPLQ